MGNFNRDNNRDNRFDHNRNSGRSSGPRSFERPEMHHAVCSNCGKDCEVPFKPTGSKPVFCSECFEKQGGNGGNDSRRPGGDNFRRPSFERRSNFEERPMFQGVCAKCGNTCELPFRPTSGRPVFCKNCFDANAAEGRPESTNTQPSQNSYQEQFDALNAKLDKILSIVTPPIPAILAEEILEEIIVKEIVKATPKVDDTPAPIKTKKAPAKKKLATA
jgi:CxxC-x17-CxxC domain-containing protein